MDRPEFDWDLAPIVEIREAETVDSASLAVYAKRELVKRGLKVAVFGRPPAGGGHLGRPGCDFVAEVGALLSSHDLILMIKNGDANPAAISAVGAVEGGTRPVERVLQRAGIVVRESIRRLEQAHEERPVFGAVLIGGASRRMGYPKHLATLGGQTLLERVLKALEPEVEHTLVVGAGELPNGLRETPRVFDAADCGSGPVAGLMTALRSAPQSCWVVAACDMAQIGVDAVRWLLGERRPGRWAVLPRTGDRIEPLLAVYEPQALSLLDGLLAAGGAAPRELAGSPRIHTPTIPCSLSARWTNVNRQADLDRIKASSG